MSASSMRSARKSRGYTVVELVITIVVIGVLIVGVFPAFSNYLILITRNSVSVDMTNETQNLLRTTVEELRYGAGVRVSSSLTDSNAPPGGWNTGNSNFVIIIAMPAVDSDRNYIIDDATGYPYNNEYIYFKSEDVLYKRILAHPDATGNSVKTSCPAALATASCPADRKLVQAVVNMVFTLYDQDDAVTADPLLAKSVKVALSLQKKSFGETISLDYDVQTTLRNNFQ